MSTKYNFQTKYLGTSSAGIHLLRNGFNFKTYSFQDISEVHLKKGRAIKNWLLIAIIGIGSISTAIYYCWRIYLFFTAEGGRFYLEELLMPIFLLAIGIGCLYVSLIKSLVMEIHIGNKKESHPVKELEKKGELSAFIDFLKQQLSSSKVKIESQT